MKSKTFKKNLLAAAIAMALPTIAISAPPENVRHYGKNAPFLIDDLPTSKVKDKLKALPASKREKAMRWLHSFVFTELDLQHLEIDNEGGVLYNDTFDTTELTDAIVDTIESPQAISTADTFKLHSKPGASNVIFIDVDGHTLSNTAWNSTYSTLQALPFDTDGIPDSFNTTEHAQIAEIWHRVAEDYAPFDVDVTTEEPSSFGPNTGRILITKNTDATGKAMPSSSAGGVAYVGVWGRSNYASYYSPALVYYNNLASYPAYISEASSHEMGHNLSLSHDGTSSVGYYTGHGSGYVSWAPIMGVGYYKQLTQWSQGEYADASQTQDDIGLITTRLNTRPDDHGDSIGQPTPLAIDTQGNIVSTTPETDPYNDAPENKGIIETRDDIDFFAFDAGAGDLTITVTPSWEAFYNDSRRGANLDIEATLYDWDGNIIASNDPLNETDAVINANVPAGQYLLSVTGVGNSSVPYSDYGSLGQYFISGTVVPFNQVTDSTPPNPDPMTWMVSPYSASRTSINMQASVATDDSGSVQYNFRCVSGPGCSDSGWQTSNQFTATGLQDGATYGYEVLARDAYSNQTAPSEVAYASTPANSAPEASNGNFTTNEDSSINIDLTTMVSDGDNDPLNYTIQTQPSNGAAVLNSGIVTYTPNANYNGSDSFVFSVSDGFTSASATVSITVNPINDAPVAAISSSNTGLTVNFSSNDSYDPDGTSNLSYSWNFGDGSSSPNANPAHAYEAGGTYSVTLTVIDTQGLKDTASTNVTVVDPNNASPGTPTNLSYAINSTVSGKGKSRTVTGTVSLTWQPADEYASSYEIWRCVETTSGKGRNKITSCNYESLDTSLGTQYTDVLQSSTAHYKVRAYNSNGFSDYSNEVIVSP